MTNPGPLSTTTLRGSRLDTSRVPDVHSRVVSLRLSARKLENMQSESFMGFRNLDKPGGHVSRAMESQALHDYAAYETPGIIALTAVDSQTSDQMLIDLAEHLPEGQTLWAFSPTSRPFRHPLIRISHAKSVTDREFQLKISHFLGKFVIGLPEGGALSPERLAFPERHASFNSLSDYSPLLDERAVVSCDLDGVPFEFFSDLRSTSKKLVVFGQSALTRSKVNLPYFFRWTWAHRIDASVMIWNDPTLYLADDLDAGWWIGSKERDYVAEASQLVVKSMKAVGASPRDVLFVGLSAGGMSAFPMATEIPGSNVLVENPRITMLAEGEKGVAVTAAIRACLGYDSADLVPHELLYRIDVIERMRKSGTVPSFTYLQNSLDSRHFSNHYLRFKEQIKLLDSYSDQTHRFVEYSQWSLIRGGHFPLKEAAMLRIINNLLFERTEMPAVLPREAVTGDQYPEA